MTIDLSRELAGELGTELVCLQFDAAVKSVAELAGGDADVGFMAIDPQRAETTHFTPAYVQIEGFYLVPAGSPIKINAERVGDARLLGEALMLIHQAMAIPKGRSADGADFLDDFVRRMARGDSVAASLRRHAIVAAKVAGD